MLAGQLGCARSEVKGTWTVDLEIAGNPRTFPGTLILSSTYLDVPALSGSDAGIEPGWLGDDVLAANSCFILAPPSKIGEEAPIVRVFEARQGSDGLRMPIEIVSASELSIEIVRLQFFSGTLGGELAIHTVEGVRPGRILGERTGAARPQVCVEAMAAFVDSLRHGAAQEGSAVEAPGGPAS
jgi:hypothetical protein